MPLSSVILTIIMDKSHEKHTKRCDYKSKSKTFGEKWRGHKSFFLPGRYWGPLLSKLLLNFTPVDHSIPTHEWARAQFAIICISGGSASLWCSLHRKDGRGLSWTICSLCFQHLWTLALTCLHLSVVTKTMCHCQLSGIFTRARLER